MTPERISLAQARRIALAAQGFAAPRVATTGTGQPGITTSGSAPLRRTLDRLGLFQIDSVNVVARAHYLPAFSRLGPYDRTLLDRAAWGPGAKRRMWEYWAHEASLLPPDVHSLLRWRMARAERGEAGWTNVRAVAHERRADAVALLDRIRADGPLAASDVEGGRTGWWAWSDAKRLLEWLFYAGHVTTATRRGSFERVYDLTERVIPTAILELPTPDEAEAQAALVARAGKALGLATTSELRDYYRLSPADGARAVARAVEEGTLLPVTVPDWPAAFLHRDARRPRRVEARALLAPFDPLVWERTRTQRLFGFRYRLEIYTPAHKREHGYYVLPFLLGDRLVARADLKADRAAGVLRVQAITREPDAPADTDEALAEELRLMAGWLALDRVEGPVEKR